MKIAAGVQVGPYQVIEQVGRGGMATVFKAYQPALERMVAIKVLPDFMAEDAAFRERFRREAVSIAKLRHPGILAVYDHGEHEGQPYIVTEFVEGGTFADELGKPIGLHRALTVLGSVASALDYAHERGILHRDVKPSNILVSRDGSAVLGDFGLARMMANNERLTRLDMVVGTPEYMSPEQCAGKDSGAASDQYALGIVAFEALTGRVPYHAETPAAVMLAQMQSPVPDPRATNPSLSPTIDRALERALAKTPADRFTTCTNFVKALEGSGAEPAQQPAPTAAVSAQRPASPAVTAGLRLPSGKPAIIAAAAVVALLALAGILYAASAGHGRTTSTAAASPTPTSTLPAHGSLVYEAGLSPTAWPGGAAPVPSPAGSVTIGYSARSIDLKIEKDGATISSEFDGPALKNYVADLVMNVDQGSDFEMNWAVRNPSATETASVYLNIQVAQETMTLVLSPNSGSNQALAATVAVPGIQTGSTVELYLVVNGDSIALYLNGKQVAAATESTVTGATTPAFDMDGKSGALHIQSLRYYATA